jgi:hypothetical protein
MKRGFPNPQGLEQPPTEKIPASAPPLNSSPRVSLPVKSDMLNGTRNYTTKMIRVVPTVGVVVSAISCFLDSSFGCIPIMNKLFANLVLWLSLSPLAVSRILDPDPVSSIVFAVPTLK